MRAFDYTFDDPHQNLALDEVLLRDAEQNDADDVLRFWESPVPFVVLGLTQRIRDEVNIEACARDQVPITRRWSGGGCVLQGPGCVNYTLILRKDRHPGIDTIHGSYDYILGKVSKAIGIERITPAGISDIALGSLKVSGNAQRRQKHFILHHGTLLYNADIHIVKRYLREPGDRPEYRGERNHDDFITNLDLSRKNLVQGIASQFGADGATTDIAEPWVQQTRNLAEEKYEVESWIYRK